MQCSRWRSPRAEAGNITLLFFRYRKMPEREDDYLTSAARLLEKKREMEEVEQALLAQREVNATAEDSFSAERSS